MRRYFTNTRGWKPVALSVLLSVALVAVFFVLQQTGSRAAEPPGPGGTAVTRRPDAGTVFAARFKAGRYGSFQRDGNYSPAFKREYLRQARLAWQRQHRSGRPFSSTGTWDSFTRHDTCASAVANVPDCTFNWKHQRLLLSSNYWDRRSEAYNRWTMRVVFCAGVGIATFSTGGTVAAAIGPGATLCLGSFLIE